MFKTIEKLMVLALILMSIQISVCASTVVSEEKLNDGSYIRMCRFSNGSIDYCTVQDGLNAMKAVNNRNLLLSKEEIAKEKAMEAKISKEYPIVNTIWNKINEYKQEDRQLQAKSNMGISVDMDKWQLLGFKLSVLNSLTGEYISISGNGNDISILGTSGISSRYGDLLNALSSKTITQSEFSEAKKKLDKDCQELQNLYNKVTSLNIRPNEAPHGWIETNYSGAGSVQNLISNPTLDGVQKVIENKLPEETKTKYQKFNSGVSSGINILNDAANNARSIRAIFGK